MKQFIQIDFKLNYLKDTNIQKIKLHMKTINPKMNVFLQVIYRFKQQYKIILWDRKIKLTLKLKRCYNYLEVI